MNVLVNAITIVKGGGLAVLTHLLEAMSHADTKITWYVAATPEIISLLPQSSKIIGVPFTWTKKTPLHHLYWYEIELPKLLKKINADLFFSQTNFLPRRKLSCPTLLLVQQAGYFSEKFKLLQQHWNKQKLNHIFWEQKSKWVCRSIKKATRVTIQTHALAQQIVDQVKIAPEKLIVIPHGPGLIKKTNYCKNFPKKKPWCIGYITKLGYQKDFDTAIKAVSILKNKGRSIRLVLTLEKNAAGFQPMLRHISELISKYDVNDCVENLDDIKEVDEINKLYESLDVFIFPSLCESFGFPLIEAMSMGLPVIVANTDSNRELTGTAGELVPPENAESLAEKVDRIFSNHDLYISASQNSIIRSQDFSWHKTGTKMLEVIHQMVNDR